MMRFLAYLGLLSATLLRLGILWAFAQDPRDSAAFCRNFPARRLGIGRHATRRSKPSRPAGADPDEQHHRTCGGSPYSAASFGGICFGSPPGLPG